MTDSEDRLKRIPLQSETKIDTSDASPSAEIYKAKTEVELLEFLHDRGIKQMQEFQPGKPLLVLLPDQVRHDQGRYRHLQPHERPCFARVDNPTKLGRDGAGNFLESDGQVDYYTINNADTPIHVRTAQSKRPFPAITEFLFEDNTLFPRT